MAVMKILARADDVLQVGTSGRRGEQSQAMSQLQMLFQGQRAGAKLPPLPFLVTNMIKHAGVSGPALSGCWDSTCMAHDWLSVLLLGRGAFDRFWEESGLDYQCKADWLVVQELNVWMGKFVER